MVDTELSLLSTASRRNNVEGLLKTFEQRGFSHVNVSFKNWDSAWSDMMTTSKRNALPSVSEVGTSWVPDLARMDALEAVPPALLEAVGGEKDYVSQSWKSCFLSGKSQMWAVPWVCGSRVLYYRQDLLSRANINPDTAFASPNAMLDAVINLREAGVARPWITSNVTSLNTLHLISTWIWAAGGDFISPDGRRLLFAEPQVIDSMATFFRMGRYMGPPQEYSYENAIELFWRGDAAITMDGTWIYDAQKATANLEVLDNLGVALAPGPAWVGGSNLAVLESARDRETAWDLLLFLAEPNSVLTMFKLTGLAPAKLSLLNSREVLQRAFGPILNRAMETGRSPQNHRFSGMIEDNLHYAFGLVWAEMLKSPNKNPREILVNYLVPLKERLEAAMRG
ncbi:MAG: extracellular solute-binding protein [Anaerolineales bacterium]